VQLNFDKTIYSVESVQLAAYRFIDRLAVHISSGEKNMICCDITVNEDLIDETNALIADFKKEILDQLLRLKIKKETEQTRNLILSLAFSKSGLQG